MASNMQAKNFPKGSYRAYTSLLKQYSPNKPAAPVAPVPQSTTTNGTTKPASVQTQKTVTANLNLEAVLALTNGQIDMLDADVLRQFLELLAKDQNSNGFQKVDRNNNEPQNVKNGHVEEDIETSKQNLIDSLKAQLARYRNE